MVEKQGVRTGYHAADMTKPEEIAGMVAFVETTFGRLDILVNNAGTQHVAPVDEFPLSAWDRINGHQPLVELSEQIGGLAVFLCSPSADQIRGASCAVDGGWTAQRRSLSVCSVSSAVRRPR